MDKTDFMNIMQLAFADAKVVDPDVVGIGLLTAHRNAKGELCMQIGSNIPDEAFLEALHDLTREKRKTRHG